MTVSGDDLQEAFQTQLFIRTDESEVRAPIVVLSGERCNVYHLLEKHFIEGSLNPQEKWWRCVRSAYKPDVLDTWRPRVNGTQLKVLQGVRLPETEAEWAALRTALRGIIAYLRSTSSVDKLLAALREFAGMVEAWWVNRKKTPGQEGAQGGGLKRSPTGVIELTGHMVKRAALDYPDPIYVQPEVMNHRILGGPMQPMQLDAGLPLVADHSGELQIVGAAAGAYVNGLAGAGNGTVYGQVYAAAPAGEGWITVAGSGGSAPAAQEEVAGNRDRPQRPSKPDTRKLCTLNVGGHYFVTTAATLLSCEGSYFWKLVQAQASGTGSGVLPSHNEYFIDRSGKVFEYVLDYLRCCRFQDSSSSNLPRDARTLGLLEREAAFYQLPGLAERAAAARERAEQSEEGGAGGALAGGRSHGAPQPMDAVFLETGFLPATEVAEAQAALLQELNALLAEKREAGYTVAKHNCGTEREGGRRNIYYHVLLRKAASA